LRARSCGEPILQTIDEGADQPELGKACFTKAFAFKCLAKSYRSSVDPAFLAIPQIGSGLARLPRARHVGTDAPLSLFKLFEEFRTLWDTGLGIRTSPAVPKASSWVATSAHWANVIRRDP
jgi:hypothetical protein